MKSFDALSVPQVLQASFPRVEGAASAGKEIPFHSIANGAAPRWIIFGDCSRAGRILRSWRPYNVSSRLKWSVVVSAASRGLLAKVPGVVTGLAHVDLTYWRRLLGLESSSLPVIYIGNPSRTRKATLFFVRNDAQIEAVAKVPLVPDASAAIQNEARFLSQIGVVPFAPKFICDDPANGIAAQAWLEGAPVPRRLTKAHVRLLDSLHVPDVYKRLSKSRASIELKLDEVDLPLTRAVRERAIELLDVDEPLPAFTEHGDFAPWNLKRLSDGSTAAIDWEWSVHQGLPCQDIFRFFYIQDALFGGGIEVWRTLKRHPLLVAHYRRFSIPEGALIPLAACYLLRTLCSEGAGGSLQVAHHACAAVSQLVNLSQENV